MKRKLRYLRPAILPVSLGTAICACEFVYGHAILAAFLAAIWLFILFLAYEPLIRLHKPMCRNCGHFRVGKEFGCCIDCGSVIHNESSRCDKYKRGKQRYYCCECRNLTITPRGAICGKHNTQRKEWWWACEDIDPKIP